MRHGVITAEVGDLCAHFVNHLFVAAGGDHAIDPIGDLADLRLVQKLRCIVIDMPTTTIAPYRRL